LQWQALNVFNILPSEQRSRFMQLFSKLLEKRRDPGIDWCVACPCFLWRPNKNMLTTMHAAVLLC
jgi:hypothetical protein